MLTFHCRYCHERLGPIAYPTGPAAERYFTAWMTLHDGCGMEAVETVKPMVFVKESNEATPIVLLTPPATSHVHVWASAMVSDSGKIFKDCWCGVRAVFGRDSFGNEFHESYVAGGTSRENAVYSAEQYQSPYIKT